MFAVVHDSRVAPLGPQEPLLTLQEYNGEELTPAIHVYLPHNLTAQEFLALFPHPSEPSSTPAFTFPALHNWFIRILSNSKLQNNESHPFFKHPYKLREIDVQAVDWFWRNRPGHQDKLGFMKMQAKIETDFYVHDGETKERADWLPGAVFLRGGSVGVLIIVQPSDAKGDNEKYVILTIQPRIAAGSLAFTEIPAGMLDGNSFKGTAASEIEEEAKLKVKESDLINLSQLVLEDVPVPSPTTATKSDQVPLIESTEAAIYPSPGACDEFIPLFLCQKRLTRRHMEWLKGKATGLRDEGENITLKLVPLEKVWREGARDGKTLAALALYGNLKREGKLSANMPSEVEEEPVELSEKIEG
ncbi:Nn.00g040910.m01.CDS01 [Neocucurbitaria sp. VM-36]